MQLGLDVSSILSPNKVRCLASQLAIPASVVILSRPTTVRIGIGGWAGRGGHSKSLDLAVRGDTLVVVPSSLNPKELQDDLSSTSRQPETINYNPSFIFKLHIIHVEAYACMQLSGQYVVTCIVCFPSENRSNSQERSPKMIYKSFSDRDQKQLLMKA